jgi:hypothetical protein
MHLLSPKLYDAPYCDNNKHTKLNETNLKINLSQKKSCIPLAFPLTLAPAGSCHMPIPCCHWLHPGQEHVLLSLPSHHFAKNEDIPKPSL